MKLNRLASLLLLTLVGCGGEPDGIGEEDPTETGPKIPYDVVIEPAQGVEALPNDLESYLLSVSRAAELAQRPPTSDLVLRTRAENDLPRLEQGLHARGYYEGDVSYTIRQERERREEDPNEVAQVADEIQQLIVGAPTKVVYRVRPGPQFTFAEEREIRLVGDPHGYAPPNMAGDLGLKAGEPAIAEEVLRAEQELLRDARNEGHAFASLGDRRVVVDYDADAMEVELALEPGPVVPFARPDVKGDEDLSERYLRSRIGIEAGETFSAAELAAARQRLIDTNLFSVVRVTAGEEVNDEGQIPVTVELTQRKHRTIGFGAGYYTDTGPRGRVFWEHRNLLEAGEQLRFEAEGSQQEQEISLSFRKPDILLIQDLNLLADASISNEDTDAFRSRSIGAGIGLERRFDRHLTGTLGLAYRFTEIKNIEGEQTYGLLSVPGSLAWDYTDSVLDPSKGWRLTLQAAPFIDTLGIGTQFLKTEAVATTYFRLINEPRLVLAFRGAGGSIAGADREEVPPDERYYAGGGGSVRGIPFQLAGPLVDGEPVGGLSYLEGSAEVRFRAFGNVELVGFIDAGSAYEEVNPAPSDVRVGIGTGLRYVTPVGPIRFDVAFPLDKRKDVDDTFQFYISIGQAF